MYLIYIQEINFGAKVFANFLKFDYGHFPNSRSRTNQNDFKEICGMIGGIRFCGCGCGWVSVRGSLRPLWHETHACAWNFLQDRKMTREGKSPRQWTKESSQQKKAVNRSRGKALVRERRLLSEEQWPVDPEAWLANVWRWVSVPGGCLGISLGYTLAIAHRCTESYRKVPKHFPSCARS